MSSQLTKAEIELARLGFAELSRGNLSTSWSPDYTALEHADVRTPIAIDAATGVIEWHRQNLLPLGRQESQAENNKEFVDDNRVKNSPLSGREFPQYDPRSQPLANRTGQEQHQ